MGVYIPGMEMPTEGTVIAIYKLDGKFYASVHGTELCPLVPVPEHGRLIDADSLIEDLKRQCKEVFRVDAVSPEDFWIKRNEAYRQRLYESWCEGFYEYVGSRPTIIPAEPPKEEQT